MNPPEDQQQVGRYRKKPVEVEAIRWTGDNIEEIVAFMAPFKPEYMAGFSNADDLLGLSGGVANKDDWVIREPGVNQFSPRHPDEFEETYEPANDHHVEVPAENLERAAEAAYESMHGLYRPWRRLERKKKDGWIKALQAAAPSICAKERERLEFDRLAEETGFEPGQKRKGGLPGEEASLVDHVLEEFARCGEDIRSAKADIEIPLRRAHELLAARGLEGATSPEELAHWTLVGALSWLDNQIGLAAQQERERIEAALKSADATKAAEQALCGFELYDGDGSQLETYAEPTGVVTRAVLDAALATLNERPTDG